MPRGARGFDDGGLALVDERPELAKGVAQLASARFVIRFTGPRTHVEVVIPRFAALADEVDLRDEGRSARGHQM